MSAIPFMDGTPDEGLNFTSGEISREFTAQVSAEVAAAMASAIYGAAPPASFPPPGDPIADLKRWAAEISALPEPIAYIVLDHDQPAGGYEERRDARGKRYVLASPSFLDGATHRKFGEIGVVGSTLCPPGLFGIPLYRREDVPPEWLAPRR